ncbi:hypothetical protein ACVWWR_007291 [Bradyrhizobium sp. LM3.2]
MMESGTRRCCLRQIFDILISWCGHYLPNFPWLTDGYCRAPRRSWLPVFEDQRAPAAHPGFLQRTRLDAPGMNSRESAERSRSADSGAVVPGIVDQVLKKPRPATPRVGVGNENDAPMLIKLRDQIATGHDFKGAWSKEWWPSPLEGFPATAEGRRAVSGFLRRSCARAGHLTGLLHKASCARHLQPYRPPARRTPFALRAAAPRAG